MKKQKLLLVLLLSVLILGACSSQPEQAHECRFYGIIFAEKNNNLKSLIRIHLDSLRQLGASNPDGWGIGYFLPSLIDTLVPVIRRGEPSAPVDPRYSETVEEVIRNVEKSTIGHIRKGSSGPVSGIPDPHPFRRKCINRKLDMLFAHNGTINEEILLHLISQVNPFYLTQNPPDYSPDYLDSDLWAILIVEIIDTYPDLSIEECIKMAVIKLDSALALEKVQMNFVMSDGNTLWALNYTKSEPKGITVYYYPDSLTSPFWVVASQPLDTSSQGWVEIPNHTLACFKPYEPVRLIPIYQKFDHINKGTTGNYISQPNPFNKSVRIQYYVSHPGIVKIKIYDKTGRLVRKLLEEYKIIGEYYVTWEGLDNNENPLTPGTYFCHIQNEYEVKVLKIILTH